MFKKGGVYSLGSILQQLISFVMIPLYTTYLGTEDYGILSLMTITAALVLTITKSTAANGFVRYYYAPGYESKRKKLFFNSVVFSLSLSLIISILFFLSAKSMSVLILGDSNYLEVVYIFSVIILLQPLVNLVQDLLIMQKRAGKFILMHVLNTVISTGLILFLILEHDMKYMALIWGAFALNVFPVLFLFSDILKNMEFKIDKNIQKEILSYGYPLTLTALSLFVIEYSDHYLIKYLLDVEKVGLYSFGFKFAFVINIILVIPVHNIINPLIFELEKDKDNLLIFIRKIFTYFIFIASAFGLMLSLFSREIIKLLAQKPEFWPSWQVVPALAFAYVFFGMMEISGKGLLLTKRTKIYGSLFGLIACLNIIMSYIFINITGIQGAAISKLISFIIINFFLIILSVRYYGITINIKKISNVLFFALGILIISHEFIIQDLLLSLLFKLMLFFVFIISILLSGVFSKDEIDYLRSKLKLLQKK